MTREEQATRNAQIITMLTTPKNGGNHPSMQEVADHFGVTRQRVHQIYQDYVEASGSAARKHTRGNSFLVVHAPLLNDVRANPRMTNAELAKRHGLKPHTVSSIIHRARKAGCDIPPRSGRICKYDYEAITRDRDNGMSICDIMEKYDISCYTTIPRIVRETHEGRVRGRA